MVRFLTQQDLFVANLRDVKVKNAQDFMFANFFSLSKRRRTKDIRYELKDGTYLRVYNNTELGLANIWDMDILLFAISQLVRAKNNGEKISNRLYFTGGDFLTFVGEGSWVRKKRSDGGEAYNKIWDKLRRLHTTFVETSIRKEGTKDWSFTFLSDIKQGTDEHGRHRGYEIVLADFVFQAIQDNKNILTLDDGYFSITSGLERFFYLWCRKAAGNKRTSWTETYESIYKKSGALENERQFRKRLRDMISRNGGGVLGYNVQEVVEGRTISLEVQRQAHKLSYRGDS
jgi:plasmid replication initiation protein